MRELFHVEKLDDKFVYKNQVFVLDSKRAIIGLLIVFTRIVSFEKLWCFRKVVTLRNDRRAVSKRPIFEVEIAGLKMDGDWQV